MSEPVPIHRQFSWFATVPQFFALASMICGGGWITDSAEGTALGAGIYLIYSFGSKAILTRHHRQGIALFREQRFDEAIVAYQDSYDFFTRYPWLDKYRSITLMDPSTACYREMALFNIAGCFGLSGDEAQSEAYYKRAVAEFPNSVIIKSVIHTNRPPE